MNCTFYDALARDDRRFLLARLVQLFLPGVPQVYYVGLLAGENDMELLSATGVGRDVNRHTFMPCEIGRAVERPLVRAQLAALRLRREHAAFRGTFAWTIEGTRAEFAWSEGASRAELSLDVSDASFELRASDDNSLKVALSSDATALAG